MKKHSVVPRSRALKMLYMVTEPAGMFTTLFLLLPLENSMRR